MVKRRPTAFITGVTGQDGAHLAKQLLDDGWSVVGGFRRNNLANLWRLIELGIQESIELVELHLNEPQRVSKLLRSCQPDHIYHLAGYSYVADSFENPTIAFQDNLIGTTYLLEAYKLECPNARFVYASSSEIYSGILDRNIIIDEFFSPLGGNPYGISKLGAQMLVALYRKKYGLFAGSAILFNHEGKFRGPEFVTRKVSSGLAHMSLNHSVDPIKVGNLDAARDWGDANEYVRAMTLMQSLDSPGDFIVASGRVSTVREFVGAAALSAGYEPVFEGSGRAEICYDKSSGRRLLEVSEKYFRKFDSPVIRGDSSRLYQSTGWIAKRTLDDIAHEMVQADLYRAGLKIQN